MTEAQVGEELLAWKSLNLRGLNVATAPAPRRKVQVGETSLAGLFAASPSTRPVASTCATSSKASRKPAPAAGSHGCGVSSGCASGLGCIGPAARANRGARPAGTRGAVWPMSLVNGKVLFSDFSSNRITRPT